MKSSFLFRPGFVLLLLALTCVSAHAQIGKKKKRQYVATGYDQTQWWIAIRAGGNISKANVQDGYYSIFSYSKPPSSEVKTSYKPWGKLGTQFGLSVSFEFLDNVSLIWMPQYSIYSYNHRSSFMWQSENDANKTVDLVYDYSTKMQYIESPLALKLEFGSGLVKPFVQCGGYYGYLVDAIKKTETKGIDKASGANGELVVNNYSADATKDYIRSNFGLLAGVGANIALGNARLTLDVNYKKGLTKISNAVHRYNETYSLSGLYDVTDNMYLENIEFSIGVYIPFKFITSRDFKAL